MLRSRRSQFLRNYLAKILLLLVIAMVSAYLIGIFFELRQNIFRGDTCDFSTFYAAGKMVLTGNSSQIYDYEGQRLAQRPFAVHGRIEVVPFVLLPYILIVFAPLALLSYSHAVMLWYGMNIVILMTLPFLLAHRLGMNEKHIALAILALAFFPPLLITLAEGQTTILTLLLFTLVFLNLDNGHDARAGSILALALYKPHFVIPLVLVLTITRNWKALRAFFLAALALMAVSATLVGWKTILGFPRAIIAFATLRPNLGGEPRGEIMPNVRGSLQWLLDSRLSHSEILLFAAIASVALVLGLVAAMAQQPRVSELGFSLAVVVTVLASYHCYEHDMALVLLPFVLVAHYVAKHEITKLRMALVMGAGLTFIMPTILSPPASAVAMLFFSVILFAENTRSGAIAGRAQVTEGAPVSELKFQKEDGRY